VAKFFPIYEFSVRLIVITVVGMEVLAAIILIEEVVVGATIVVLVEAKVV